MDARTTQALLYLDGVSVSFDGFKALNNLSLVMDPGEMRAIIGPNGAGKTTMMDVITGKTRPDAGDVVFQGAHDLTALDEAEIATLGIGRKFQKPTVFEFHTVEDNLLLALKGVRGVFANLTYRLAVENLDLHYGAAQALRSVSISAEIGKIACVMGRNGVGKTSLMRAIVGQKTPSRGRILWNGEDVTRLPPFERARRGIALVPQGREIFPLLSVEENLRTGFAPLDRARRSIPDDVFSLFPVLAQMLRRRGG